MPWWGRSFGWRMMTCMTSGHIRLRSATGRWVLLTTVLGSSLATLDGTVVNVALPALGRDLDAGMSGLQWTVNGYTLTMAALILLGGSLGDRLGRRKIFVVGVVWFALASALCGLAPSAPCSCSPARYRASGRPC